MLISFSLRQLNSSGVTAVSFIMENMFIAGLSLREIRSVKRAVSVSQDETMEFTPMSKMDLES